MLEAHPAADARSFMELTVGTRTAARTAIMTMTIKTSVRVNPADLGMDAWLVLVFMFFASVLKQRSKLLHLTQSVNPAIWPGSSKIDACEADGTPRPNNPFQKRKFCVCL
jgi:hypothetical protein